MAGSSEEVSVALKLRKAKQFSSGMKGAGRDVRKFGKEADVAAKRTKALDSANRRINAGFGVVGRTIRTGLTLGMAGLGAEVFRATKGWYEHQQVVRRTNAVVKSTSGVANVSAKHVGRLSDALERQTGMDGDVIQSGANMLLTFTNIRNGVGKNNKVFDQATNTLTGMAQAMGTDPQKAAIQLGKALNDPVKGITALSKVGVSFTDDQKKQIQTLVDSGKTMEAQKIILRELNKEFPKVKATPFQRLQVTLRQLEDTVGAALLPIFNKGVRALNKFLRQMQNGTGAGGKFVRILKRVFNAGKDVVNWIAGLIRDFKDGKAGAVLLVSALAALVSGLGAFVILVKVAQMIKAVRTAWALLNVAFGASPMGLVIIGVAAAAAAFFVLYKKVGWFRKGVDAVFGWIKKHWPLLLTILTGPFGLAASYVIKHWKGVKDFFAGIPGALKGAFVSVLNWIIDRLNDVIGFINKAIDIYNKVPFHKDLGHIGLIGHVGGDAPSGDGSMARPSASVVRRRTDPSRVALRPAAASAAADGAGGGDTVLHNYVVVDGEVVTKSVTRHTKKKARTR